MRLPKCRHSNRGLMQRVETVETGMQSGMHRVAFPRFGTLHSINEASNIVSYKVLLPGVDRQVVVATARNQYRELFSKFSRAKEHDFVGLGGLGLLLSVTLRVIPITEYVRLAYDSTVYGEYKYPPLIKKPRTLSDLRVCVPQKPRQKGPRQGRRREPKDKVLGLLSVAQGRESERVDAGGFGLSRKFLRYMSRAVRPKDLRDTSAAKGLYSFLVDEFAEADVDLTGHVNIEKQLPALLIRAAGPARYFGYSPILAVTADKKILLEKREACECPYALGDGPG